MAVTDLHVYGWHQETVLQPVLEACVGETIQKTRKRYDTIDFEGPSCVVELKCRSAYDKHHRLLTSDTHPTWLVPASKIDYAEQCSKRFFIFYWFAGDQTLWVIEYAKGMFAGLSVERPIWHSEKSEHYYVPAEMWSKVEVEYETEK